MFKKKSVFLMTVGVIAASIVILCAASGVKSTEAPRLSGIVSSDAEGPMEGVLVSAKLAGGTITVTVVTDKQGRYDFPTAKLVPGPYDLTIRAVGYDTPDQTSVVVGQKRSEFNLKLNKTKDLASQLTWGEWVMSAPGTPEQKDALYSCTACHTGDHVFKSKYDAQGWLETLVRMRNWETASVFSHPTLLPYHEGPRPRDPDFAKYLSSINLSGGKSHWDFELKTLPRPTGESTRVIMTEYDLPRADAEPHDAILDAEGMVWYCDFAEGILGRLDPHTGQTKEWPLPTVKPGFPVGSLDTKIDRDGNVWIARSFQAAIAKFDKKTEKITTWTVPAEYNNVHSRISFIAPTPDGRVWLTDTFNRMMHLLDPKTGKFLSFQAYPDFKWSWESDAGSGGRGKAPRGHFIYGIGSDSRGWGYFSDMAGGNIGEIDPETGKVVLYPTPTVNAGPRRMHIDSKDQLWFGEEYSGKIGLFDIKTKQMKEWEDPTRVDDDYDALIDKAGFVWTGGVVTDLVGRLNPKTGQMVQYLLPRVGVNVRGINVDNRTTPPSLLIGENHQAKIVLVQPLE
jgi:virginiamycin B lyase